MNPAALDRDDTNCATCDLPHIGTMLPPVIISVMYEYRRCDMNERMTAASVTQETAGVLGRTALRAERPCEHSRVDAAECQEIATCWPDLFERHYEDLARQWLVLAERAEQNSSRRCLRS
jgi:hypothetical protein